jgi:hypothetical protein
VFSAATSLTFDEVIAGLNKTSDLTPFTFRDNRLWTFHDITDEDGPFSAVVDRDSVETMRADDAWRDPDNHRIYVSLLNRSLSLYLGRKGPSL